MYIVYMVTGPGGKQYIGKTRWTIERRWGEHVRFAFIQNEHTGTWYTVLSKAIRKYGASAFSIAEIVQCVDNREAVACERGLIAQHGTFRNGYNMTTGGEGADGYRHSPEMLAHLSSLKKGKPGNRLGKKHSPETIERLRIAHAGRKDLTPEGWARIGSGGWKRRGRKRSGETIEKWRESRAGYKHSDETRAKISARANRGKRISAAYQGALKSRSPTYKAMVQ